MVNGYLRGTDAIDLARCADLDLHRAPCKPGAKADTSAVQADLLIASGQATPDDFYLDMDRMPPEEAGHAILSLIGLLKGWRETCTD